MKSMLGNINFDESLKTFSHVSSYELISLQRDSSADLPFSEYVNKINAHIELNFQLSRKIMKRWGDDELNFNVINIIIALGSCENESF